MVLPWYWQRGVAIFMGSAVLWIAFSREPLSGRNGNPYPDQQFLRSCLALLGVSMIGLSLWGLWLDKP
jgi:hypothetical protein